ncbi:unnamed protein product, partial [Didymodactylos carnosus]
ELPLTQEQVRACIKDSPTKTIRALAAAIFGQTSDVHTSVRKCESDVIELMIRYVKAKFSGVMADDVKLRRAVTNSLVYQRQKRKQADEHSQTKQKNNLISKNGEQKIAPAESIDEQSEVE